MGIELSTGNIRQLVILKKEVVKSQIDSGQANLILKVYTDELFKKAMFMYSLVGSRTFSLLSLTKQVTPSTLYSEIFYRTLYRFKITTRTEK